MIYEFFCGSYAEVGEDGISKFRLDIGTDGYLEKVGFTNKDQLRAQAVRDMAAQAESVLILTESEKFTQRGTVPLGIGDTLRCVITDENIPDHNKEVLEKSGIQVTLA